MRNMKKALQQGLRDLDRQSLEQLLEARFQRLMGHGQYKEAAGK